MSTLSDPFDWPAVILNLRKALWMTQADLARELGCNTESTVSKWENGQAIPQLRFRRKLRDLGESNDFSVKSWPQKETTPLRAVDS